jgi:rod shape-determining protein MreB
MGRSRVSGRDIAVDLGTANTLVYVRGHGIVISEPSVVAIDEQSGTVRAVGSQAKQMIGRAPAQLTVVRPLANGVIADFEVAAEMLRYFLRQVGGRYTRSRVVLCVPSGVTDVEKRAVEEAALEAGAREAYLIEEPVAAAIGAGLPVGEARGNMIVDIGGGTTEVAVVSLGGIVVSQSLRVAGDNMDEAIMSAIRRDYHVVIGQPTAEQLKLEIGSALHPDSDNDNRGSGEAGGDSDGEIAAELRGRDQRSGLPRPLVIEAEYVSRSLEEPISEIVQAVMQTLDQTPPELAADIIDSGIVLAGGGALLRRLPERLRAELQLPVIVAESPLTCVAVGAGKSLEQIEAISASQRTHRRH